MIDIHILTFLINIIIDVKLLEDLFTILKLYFKILYSLLLSCLSIEKSKKINPKSSFSYD